MIIFVRTTVILDDQLLKQAKREAARRGLSLSALLEQALRSELLEHRKPPAQRFEMLTYGSGSPPRRHEPADFAAASESEDAESIGG